MEEVDPAGDVVFVCKASSDDAATSKIRVDSSMLQRASPVFKAMLQPKFREGNELAATSTCEIPLPDDEVGPMTILLNIMHLRNASVPQKLAPTQIIDVVNLAKKYLCVEVVQLASQIWLASNMPLHRHALYSTCCDRLHRDADVNTCGRLLTAAHHLGRDDLINELGEAIVRNSTSRSKVTDEYTMYGVEGDKELEMIVGMLKSHKNKKLESITLQLNNLHKAFERTRAPKSCLGIPDIHECPDSCFVAEVSAYELNDYLRQNELDDETRQRCELQRVLDSLKRLPSKFPFSSRYRPCSAGCVYHKLARAYNSVFQGNVKKLCRSKQLLLCMEGYRKYGGWGEKVGIGYCSHCEGDTRVKIMVVPNRWTSLDEETSSDEE